MEKNIINYIKTLTDNKKIQELLIKTIGNILLKQDNIENFIKKNDNKIIHIRDWISSVIQNNEEWKTPRVLTIEALNNAANKYFQKQNNKIQTIELNEKHEKLIANLDNYYIVQMLTPQALDNESKQMQHCIGYGGYDNKIENEIYKFLSLRYKFNKAHVTLEIYRHSVLQIQGKQNQLPDNEYLKELIPWLIKEKYHFNLSKYGYIFNQNDNKIYSINNIPNNCKISESLVLDENTKELPNNFTINGDLNLELCYQLKQLPNNLIVNGNLVLTRSNIKKIPDDIKIGQNLLLNGSKIDYLPENLTVNNLELINCNNLKKIPNNLTINGNLKSIFSKFGSIPNNIKINNNLNLDWSKIEKLPNNLIVNDLDLTGCRNIKELPKNLTVNGKLILEYSNIKKISENTILKNLDLKFTKIKSLPDDLIIKHFLKLGYSKIEKLPENIKINGHLDINDSKIKKLPDKLSCYEIKMSEEQIYLIKKSMNFNMITINYESYSRKNFLEKFSDKIDKPLNSSITEKIISFFK